MLCGSSLLFLLSVQSTCTEVTGLGLMYTTTPPPYAGDSPAVTSADLEDMAADGVQTLYLQAARLDSRSPDGIQDKWLLAEMLIGAHEKGMAVVAWYLPKWGA